MASLEEGRAKGEVSPKQNVKLVIAQIEHAPGEDEDRSDFQPPPEKLEKLSSERRAPRHQQDRQIAKRAHFASAQQVPDLTSPTSSCRSLASEPGLWGRCQEGPGTRPP